MTGFDAAIPGYVRYSMVVDASKGIYNLRLHNVQMDDEAEYQCQHTFRFNRCVVVSGQQPINTASRNNTGMPDLYPPPPVCKTARNYKSLEADTKFSLFQLPVLCV
ncbi:hypothetical protein CEXT_715161 [Caerostris extrusa]|uniref:Uncharacterized protein n=1 Tax=Caerostris extrusa TaxID=172846 RepID=A0AAV4WZQ8_CAEEX|nr:hypothetical protein CEXT_715161 [Caerostris extrusa]